MYASLVAWNGGLWGDCIVRTKLDWLIVWNWDGCMVWYGSDPCYDVGLKDKRENKISVWKSCNPTDVLFQTVSLYNVNHPGLKDLRLPSASSGQYRAVGLGWGQMATLLTCMPKVKLSKVTDCLLRFAASVLQKPGGTSQSSGQHKYLYSPLCKTNPLPPIRNNTNIYNPPTLHC